MIENIKKHRNFINGEHEIYVKIYDKVIVQLNNIIHTKLFFEIHSELYRQVYIVY